MSLNDNSSTQDSTQSSSTNNAINELKGMLEGAGYSVKKKSALLKEHAIEYAKNNPLESIAISALTGALIALLLRK